MTPEERTKRIRELNDQFRTTFTGGSVYMTRGVDALPPEVRAEIVAAVRGFDAFTEDNDPHGEHDFGMVRVQSRQILFKIDVYDLRLKYSSPDSSDPAVSRRVLTVMLVEEY